MEKRWNGEKPAALQILATGIIVAGSVLLLPALANLLARHVGVLIGNAVAAVVRELLSALGVVIPPRHDVPETRLPFPPFRG